jgi:hypothetical protein
MNLATALADRPMRVYVSSTALDLMRFRKAVIDSIRKLGDRRYTVVCMEDYTSEDAFPPDKCRRDVAGCDTYLGLFGFRYGTVPAGSDISITEMEYREAVATGKTILIFLASDDIVEIPVKLIDRDASRSRIDSLRQELAARYLVNEFFKTPDDAAKQAVTALTRILWPPPPPAAGASREAATADASPDRWLQPYLEWVVAAHANLELPGVRGGTRLPVRLEQVYVALRGDRAGAYELVHSRDLLEDDLVELHKLYRELPDAERRQLRARLLRQNPYMLSLLERDRPGGTLEKDAGRSIPVTLAEAFRKERWLVILGDPGSGKTTLGRWLAVKLARALQHPDPAAEERVRVPAFQVNPETPYDRRLLDLGPARLPILVRVAKFAQALALARTAGDTLLLVDWLCQVSWNERPPAAGERIPESALARLFHQYLVAGRAVIVLDGLDEITEAVDRTEVVWAIEQFVRDWIPAADRAAGDPGRPPAGGPIVLGPPHLLGGNQLVVTSRIAGYHAAPLTATAMTHVTIEPMRRPAVEHFCDTWMQAVHEILHPQLAPADRERQARLRAAELKQAIFDPARPGVEEIASNPLLVTILASLFLKREGNLPGSRVELYQTAIEMLIEDWRDAGLSIEEAFFVLDPLAAFIHERYPTGLIEETELRQVVTEHLALYRNLPANNPPPALAEDVRTFVHKVRDQVGLIAARGEQLYGFLHLTFQEYLAGRYLTRNPLTAASAVAARLGDPRWREPILLALGYAVWKWTPDRRRDLLNTLLATDDPLGVFLPRAALFVVDALTEMKGVPEESFRLLVRRLLIAYADRDTLDRFPALRQRIEEAFQKVRRFGHREWMDEELAEAIRTAGAEGLAPAAAALVREHEWFTPLVVEALTEGLDNDSEAWGWPIEQSLRDLVSPEVAEVKPELPTPPDAELRAVQERLRRLESGELLAETAAQLAAIDRAAAAECRSVVVRVEEDLRALDARSAAARAANDETALKSLDRERRARAADLPDPRLDLELDRLTAQRADLEDTGESTRQQLLEKMDKAQIELQKRQRGPWRDREVVRDRAATAGYRRWELRQVQRARSPLPTAELRFRGALEREPELLRRVTGSATWLAAVTAVYGGYPNCRAEQTHREYHEIATFLQKNEAERELIMDADPAAFVGRFGDNTVYQMAVYLDEKMGGWMNLSRTAPAFSPAAIHRTSPLDPILLTALRGDAGRDSLARDLRRAWQNSPTLRGKTDALLALVALGEEVTADLEAALADAARRRTAETALAHLSRTADFLHDSIYRAGTVVIKELSTLDERDPFLWVDIVETVLQELVGSTRSPIGYPALLQAAPADYRPALEADGWYCRINASDDRVYSTSVFIDEMPEAEPLIRGLAAAHRAPNRRQGRLSIQWEIDPLPPRFVDDPTEIPIEALAALATFHAGDVRPDLEIPFFDTAFGKLEKRVEAAPHQKPELAALALSVGCFEAACRLMPQLGASRDPLATIAEAARREDDPYHRVRGLAAVMSFFAAPVRRGLFEDALRTADAVGDPLRRTRVLELLLPHAGEVERKGVLDKAVTAATLIADPDNRCRMLARLSRWVNGPPAAEVWARALDAAATIPGEDHRAETLQLIGPYVPADAETQRRRQRALGTLRSGRLRARAAGALGLLFLREPPPSLAALIDQDTAAWAPVLLAAAIRDTLAIFRREQTSRGTWAAVRDRPADHAAVAELLERGGENGLLLNRDATQAIDALIAAGERESLALLLPLLQTPTREAFPFVEPWTRHTDQFIAHHATLYLAEEGRKFNAQTVPGLVALLSEGADRSRCRAKLVFSSHVLNAERESLQLQLSRLGAETMDLIAREQADVADFDARVHPLYFIAADTVFDAPEAIRHWVDRCGRPGAERRQAEEILRNILALSDDAWPALLAGLESRHRPARLAVLQSLCCLAFLRNRLPAQWAAPVVEALRRLDPKELAELRVLPNFTLRGLGNDGAKDVPIPAHSAQVVAEIAIAVSQTQTIDPPSACAAADRKLQESVGSFADILGEATDSSLLARLASIGGNFFTWLDGSDPEVKAAGDLFDEHPEAFAVLVAWLTETLQTGEAESEWFPKAQALLRLTAELAGRMPAAIVKLADARRLEPLLIQAAQNQVGKYGRRAAVVLLGHLRQVSQRVIKAFLFALRDDRAIQEAAIQSAERYQELRPDALAPLLGALHDDSAVVAYGVSRMLSAIGRQERIQSDHRNEILSALAAALRDRRSRRGVYLYTGSGNDDGNDAVRIVRVDRLDRAFYRAILEITGVVGQ